MLATEKGAIPLYVQVRNLFIGKISQGEWLPGDIIPSEISLSQELGVSQGTVRKAITDLVETNVLRRKQGLGTFVSNHDSDRALFHFFHIVNNQGHKVLPDSKVLGCRCKAATRHEAFQLQLPAGEKVIRIERVRSIESTPTIVETISLPEKRFAALGREDALDLPNTLYEYYETQFNVTIHHSEESLRAVSASKREASLLNLAAGTPLLEIERIALTLDNIPVELRVSRCSTKNHHYENTVF